MYTCNYGGFTWTPPSLLRLVQSWLLLLSPPRIRCLSNNDDNDDNNDDDDDDDDDAGLREKEAEISRCRTAGCRWLRHSGFKIKECSTCAGGDDDAAAGCDTSSSTLEIKECPTCAGDDDHYHHDDDGGDDDDGDGGVHWSPCLILSSAASCEQQEKLSPPTQTLFSPEKGTDMERIQPSNEACHHLYGHSHHQSHHHRHCFIDVSIIIEI